MYRDCFLPSEEMPLGYGIFEVLLKTLLEEGFYSDDIIKGFRTMDLTVLTYKLNLKNLGIGLGQVTTSEKSIALRKKHTTIFLLTVALIGRLK